MRANFYLCDFAEVLGGKLYMMGAGWSRFILAPERRQINVSIAGIIYVPWDQTNVRSTLNLALFNEDGNIVEQESSRKVQHEGIFEVGRPPGTAKGAELDIPFAFRFEQLTLPTGRFEFRLRIGEEDLYQTAFDVLEFPQSN